jgi:hypothetical protein
MIVQAHVALAKWVRQAWTAYLREVDRILDQQAAEDRKRRAENLPPWLPS